MVCVLALQIPGVFEEFDFKMVVTRDKFQSLTQDLVERAMAPVSQVLRDSGLSPQHIAKVIILGGSTRIPAVQSALKALLKRDVLDQNLDGDEAFALGAAFVAANASTAFRVRPFGMSDITPFGVGVELKTKAGLGM